MKRATDIIPANECADISCISTITLTYDDRHRRRIKMSADDGEPFLLDLAEATHLSDGDGLKLEDGDVILVKAAAEDVLDIHCPTSAETARIAWHIGNRHTPVQVLGDGALRIAYDHVLDHMVQGLGAETERKQAPFSPEHGAYDGGNHAHEH